MERLLSISSLLCGLLLISSLVSLCAILSKSNMVRREPHRAFIEHPQELLCSSMHYCQVTRLLTLRRYLREHGVPRMVAGRVQEMVKVRLYNRKRLIDKVESREPDTYVASFLNKRVRSWRRLPNQSLCVGPHHSEDSVLVIQLLSTVRWASVAICLSLGCEPGILCTM
eukprot:6479573-Amphidinium_carterae.1